MIYEKLIDKSESISVIGLGYVGLPLAVAFSKKFKVVGFDISNEKIKMYKSGIDPTREVGNESILNSTIYFTEKINDIKDSLLYIVTVPTPINGDKSPDLSPVKNASKLVGKSLKKGSMVVYESTVYPGVTEEICIPILEKESNLKAGIDFKVGYSPERINPGDKINTLEKIKKVVSAMDEESLIDVENIYSEIIDAGVHKASSIKVAEASKVIENSQRDINIAFMNELSMVFNLMNIDTYEVIEAASTKWNFLKFSPGLVGGHCIGVDPYYFTYKAEELGYHSQIILSGRNINNEMPNFVVQNIFKELISKKVNIVNANIGVFGLTFKENCPDIRNSKNIEIVKLLSEYGINVNSYDTEADEVTLLEEYNIKLSNLKDTPNLDLLVIAVPHNNAKKMLKEYIEKNPKLIVFDLKQALKNDIDQEKHDYWSL